MKTVLVNLQYFAVFLLATALVGDAVAQHRSGTSGQLRRGVTIVQSVTGIDTPTSVSRGSVGSVAFNLTRGVRSDSGGGQIPNAVAVASVPIQAYGNGTFSAAGILGQARALYGATRANAVAAQLRAYLNANGLAAGTFLLEQEVQPASVTRRMKLVWQINVADNGRVIYGDPEVVDPDPTIVYAIYTPAAVMTGLPANWAYPDAGTLRWQLRRLDGTPVSAWETINTGPQFDEPDTGDMNRGINCLANRSNGASCNPTPWARDIRALVEDTSSRSAIIDYMRRVAPVYDSAPDPANPGQFVQVARSAVSYDDRRITINGCTDRQYRNIGRVGFTLSTAIERYFYLPTENLPVLVNRQAGTSLSPTLNFDVTAPTTLRASQLNGLVIPPINPNNQIVPVAEIAGVSFLAPINVQNNSSMTLLSANLFQGGAAFNGFGWWWYDGGSEYVVGMSAAGGGTVGAEFVVNATTCNAEPQGRLTTNYADDATVIGFNGMPMTSAGSLFFVDWEGAPRGAFGAQLGSFGALSTRWGTLDVGWQAPWWVTRSWIECTQSDWEGNCVSTDWRTVTVPDIRVVWPVETGRVNWGYTGPLWSNLMTTPLRVQMVIGMAGLGSGALEYRVRKILD